jgi:hypothetical protein
VFDDERDLRLEPARWRVEVVEEHMKVERLSRLVSFTAELVDRAGATTADEDGGWITEFVDWFGPGMEAYVSDWRNLLATDDGAAAAAKQVINDGKRAAQTATDEDVPAPLRALAQVVVRLNGARTEQTNTRPIGFGPTGRT